jgi:hypothetical protein
MARGWGERLAGLNWLHDVGEFVEVKGAYAHVHAAHSVRARDKWAEGSFGFVCWWRG